jgi:hypothetical protein
MGACGSSQDGAEDSTGAEQWSQIERGGSDRQMEGEPTENEEPSSWELTEDTEFKGRLLIINSSGEDISRIWFSPSDTDDFGVGYEWPETQTVEDGQTAAGPVVEGWWDVWLESKSGADATIMRVYIKPDAVTRMNVESAWWDSGDLLGSDLNFSLH